MILFLVFVMLNHISNHWPWVNMMVTYNFYKFFEIDKLLKLIDFNTLMILPWKTHDKNSADIRHWIQSHLHGMHYQTYIFIMLYHILFINNFRVGMTIFLHFTYYLIQHETSYVYTSMITKLTKMMLISIREHLL